MSKGASPTGQSAIGEQLHLVGQFLALGAARGGLNRVLLLPGGPGHRAVRRLDDRVVVHQAFPSCVRCPATINAGTFQRGSWEAWPGGEKQKTQKRT